MKAHGIKWWAAPAMLAAICLVLTAPVRGDTVLQDNNSTAYIDTDGGTGMTSWVVDGVDHLSQQWFWYRVGNAAEAPLANGGNLILVGEIASNGDFDVGNEHMVALYRDVDNRFTIQVTFDLNGGLPGNSTSDIAEVITINNLTNSSLDFHFYQYTDLDLGGDATDLAVVIEDADEPHHAMQYDESFVMSETTENPTATHGEVGLYPTTLAELSDGVATTLSDSLGPVGPGDLTWAFEWDIVIPANGTWQLSKDKQIRPFVPEPMTMAGLVLGIGALVGYTKKRRAA